MVVGFFGTGVREIVTDFPDARWIQASVGVHPDLSSQVGGAVSLTPGDDQDGGWGNIFVPRESRVRLFGFISGDTKPYMFLAPRALASL